MTSATGASATTGAACSHGTRALSKACFVVSSLVMLVVTTGVALILFSAVRRLVPALGMFGAASWSLGLLAAAAFLGGLAWLARSHAPAPTFVFLASLVLLSSIVKAGLFFGLHSPFVSDFGAMWAAAGEMARSGDLRAYSILHQRALPILLPAWAVLGSAASSVFIANLAVSAATLLLVYGALRRLGSEGTARFVVAILAFAPELLAATNIPSHDVYGLLFLALYLWLLASATSERPWPARTIAAIAGGAALILLDLQRSTGIVLVASTVIALVCGLRIRRTGNTQALQRCVAFTAIAASVLLVGNGVLDRAGLRWGSVDPPSGFHSAALEGIPPDLLVGVASPALNRDTFFAAHGTSASNGNWAWMKRFREDFMATLPADQRHDFAIALPLSDATLQPWKRLGNVVARAVSLSEVGRSFSFYWRPGGRFDGVLPGALVIYNLLALLALSLTALIGLWRRPSVFGAFGLCVALCYPFVIALALLLTAESQPRYIIPVWVALALLAASAFEPRDAARAGDVSLAARLAIGATALALGGLIVWTIANASYGDEDGRVLDGWTFATPSQVPTVKPDHRDRHLARFGRLAFQLDGRRQAAEHALTAERTLCYDRTDRQAIGFFASAGGISASTAARYRMELIRDGMLLDSRPLPFGKPTWTRVVLGTGTGTCARIGLRLRSESSAVGRTRLDVFFPRLVR